MRRRAAARGGLRPRRAVTPPLSAATLLWARRAPRRSPSSAAAGLWSGVEGLRCSKGSWNLAPWSCRSKPRSACGRQAYSNDLHFLEIRGRCRRSPPRVRGRARRAARAQAVLTATRSGSCGLPWSLREEAPEAITRAACGRRPRAPGDLLGRAHTAMGLPIISITGRCEPAGGHRARRWPGGPRPSRRCCVRGSRRRRLTRQTPHVLGPPRGSGSSAARGPPPAARIRPPATPRPSRRYSSFDSTMRIGSPGPGSRNPPQCPLRVM